MVNINVQQSPEMAPEGGYEMCIHTCNEDGCEPSPGAGILWKREGNSARRHAISQTKHKLCDEECPGFPLLGVIKSDRDRLEHTVQVSYKEARQYLKKMRSIEERHREEEEEQDDEDEDDDQEIDSEFYFLNTDLSFGSHRATQG